MRSLAITGSGVVSGLGVGLSDFHGALDSRAPDALQLSGPVEGIPDGLAAGFELVAVRDFDARDFLGKKGLRNFDRLTCMLIVSVREALEQAGIKAEGAFRHFDAGEVGLCTATAFGSLASITETNRVVELENPRFINPSRFPNTVINSASGHASIWEELRALNVTLVDGQTGPIDALLSASIHLDAGRARALVVVGADEISEAQLVAWRRLAGRRVPRLGEGAASLVVEALEGARKRGACILGQVCGLGFAYQAPAEAGRLVRPSADAVARAIDGALSDAGLQARDLGRVVSTSGGLPGVFECEAAALARSCAGVPVDRPGKFWGEAHAAGAGQALLAALGWLSRAGAAGVPDAGSHALVLATGLRGSASAAVLSGAPVDPA